MVKNNGKKETYNTLLEYEEEEENVDKPKSNLQVKPASLYSINDAS